MCLRLAFILMLTLVCLFVFVFPKKHKVRHGPSGMSFNDTTTCVEFAKFARFNPYSVLMEKWFVFYYWGPPMPHETFIFTFPTANHTRILHKLLDGNTILPVDWRARHILMEDHKNETSLLVERSDRGEYWMYILYKVTKGNKIRPRDVRLKQTGDNRLLGFMDCDKETLFVMSRLNDVPPKKHLQDEAARLGFRGRRGKSYLYQGHEWMPIPEDDEKHYWQRNKKNKGSNEVESSEQSSEEVASEKNNISETSEKTVKNTTEIPEEITNDTLEKPEENKVITQEKIEEKEKNTTENAEEIKNDTPHNAEENENIEQISHELVSVDENELKSNCIEILPEPWEPENEESAKKPEVITKEYLDHIAVSVVDAAEPTDVVDSTTSTDTKENKIEGDINDKQEKIQDKNESGRIPTDKLKDDSTIEEPQSTNEPRNQCEDCNEYVTSTDQPYVPENAHTSKYLENTRFADRPVSQSLPATTQDPSETSPNTTNDLNESGHSVKFKEVVKQ